MVNEEDHWIEEREWSMKKIIGSKTKSSITEIGRSMRTIKEEGCSIKRREKSMGTLDRSNRRIQ
jgi:hypothetical protein